MLESAADFDSLHAASTNPTAATTTTARRPPQKITAAMVRIHRPDAPGTPSYVMSARGRDSVPSVRLGAKQ